MALERLKWRVFWPVYEKLIYCRSYSTDYDECNPQTNVHIQDCGPNEKCVNSEGTYTCICTGNYTGVSPNCERKDGYLFVCLFVCFYIK